MVDKLSIHDPVKLSRAIANCGNRGGGRLRADGADDVLLPSRLDAFFRSHHPAIRWRWEKGEQRTIQIDVPAAGRVPILAIDGNACGADTRLVQTVQESRGTALIITSDFDRMQAFKEAVARFGLRPVEATPATAMDSLVASCEGVSVCVVDVSDWRSGGGFLTAAARNHGCPVLVCANDPEGVRGWADDAVLFWTIAQLRARVAWEVESLVRMPRSRTTVPGCATQQTPASQSHSSDRQRIHAVSRLLSAIRGPARRVFLPVTTIATLLALAVVALASSTPASGQLMTALPAVHGVSSTLLNSAVRQQVRSQQNDTPPVPVVCRIWKDMSPSLLDSTVVEADVAGRRTRPDGEPLRSYLKRTAGNRPAMLVWGSTTCAPCIEEVPALRAWAESYRDRVAFLGFLTESPPADPRKPDRLFQHAFSASGFPYAYMADQEAFAEAFGPEAALPAFVLLEPHREPIACQGAAYRKTETGNELERWLDRR